MGTLKTIPGGSVTGPALWAAAQVRVALWNRTGRSRSALEGSQLAQLHRNVKAAASTEFGRAHGFEGVKSYQDFKERVPLRAYADFEPYLERMRQGQRNVLWPGLVRYYGQSSGSSNTKAEHKFLPISDAQIRWQQRAGFDVLARYLALSGDRGLTSGFALGLFPPSTLKPSGPVYITNNPGLMQRNVPFPARRLQLPQNPIRDMDNYDQKLERIAESYLDHDVRSVSGTTCWFPILFEKVLAAARAQGRRAEAVKDVWPNLRVLFGGGVHAGPYRQLIDRLVGHRTVLMDNYNATEGGLFACTDRLDEGGMLMIPDRGVFYELVPREEHGKPNARRCALWEADPHTEYSVVLTTSSGLFAYTIGDSIRFTSVFPHRMEFTGRMSGMLSLTQELTSYVEIERAVEQAALAEPCSIVEFAASTEVGVDETAKGRYLLFVEFERDPESLERFTLAFDAGLRTQNRVYREHRSQDVAILAPRVVQLPRGATQRFFKELGGTSVQHKFPRIVDDHRREPSSPGAAEPIAMEMTTSLALFGGAPAVNKSLHVRWPIVGEAEKAGLMQALQRVVERGVLSGHLAPEIRSLEREFAEYLGVKYAVATNSGTAALHIALAAAGIGPGDEVITPAFSFVATALSVLQQNAIPVFVDIEPETFGMDPRLIEAAITPRTRGLLPVHMHGLACDLKPMLAIAEKHGLRLIEDAAQAHGSTLDGRKVGTYGALGAFSLQSSKNLAGGEGGICVTDDEQLYLKASSARMFGEDIQPADEGAYRLDRALDGTRAYDSKGMGWMYRTNELSAAVARTQLRRLDESNHNGQANAELLGHRLRDLPGVTPPTVPPGRTSVFHKYRVRFDASVLGVKVPATLVRDTLLKALVAEGVDAVLWQTKPVPGQTLFREKIGFGRNGTTTGLGCPWDHGQPVSYDLAQYPETTKLLDGSLCLFSQTYPIYAQPRVLAEQYADAFAKVWGALPALLAR